MPQPAPPPSAPAPPAPEMAPEAAFDTAVAGALRRLRDRVQGGAQTAPAPDSGAGAEIRPGRPLVPGVWVAADTREGRLSLEDTTPPGGLLALRVRVDRPGRWLSVNLALARAPLRPGTVLGLVAALRCAPAGRIGVTIRSGRAGTETDDRFPDPLHARPGPGPGPGSGPSISVALMEVGADMALAGPADWRNLMLRLPVRTQELEVCDLRLFLVPPGTVPSLAAAPAVSAAPP